MMSTLRATLLLTLLAVAPLCSAQDSIQVVDKGTPIMAMPGAWEAGNTLVVVKRETADSLEGLFARRDIGAGDFHVSARLRLPRLNGSGAAFQLGGSWFVFDGPNGTRFLAGDLVGGRHFPIPHASLAPNAWFTFEATRRGPELKFWIDGTLASIVRSLVAGGTIGFTFAPVGGRRDGPAFDAVHISDFRVSGHMHDFGSVNPRGFTIPLIDLAHESHRQTLVDRVPGQYLGHPTTVLLEDGQTIITVYPKGHGRGAIVMKKSIDGGHTWSERLPVPENWATSQEVPTLYLVVDSLGTKRLVMFSGLHPIRMAVSEDLGETWTPLTPIGDFGGIVAMSDLVRLSNGDYLAFFHDDGRFINPIEQAPGQFYVYQTRSTDGGLTWGPPSVVTTHPDADLCEPGLIRSPDGRQLAMLLRENSRQFNSFVTFSDDEGTTWSAPTELPGALTGDRHQAVYGPDGRLFISFRDRTHVSPTWGDWVGWVGTYDDIAAGRPGQYRIRLMDNLQGADTAYPGVEILPDGTVVTTTYGHWTEGEAPYIMSVRFTFDELDSRLNRPD